VTHKNLQPTAVGLTEIKKATKYEKDGYFINAWLSLKFPPKVQLV
jgi:hypothetical protein